MDRHCDSTQWVYPVSVFQVPFYPNAPSLLTSDLAELCIQTLIHLQADTVGFSDVPVVWLNCFVITGKDIKWKLVENITCRLNMKHNIITQAQHRKEFRAQVRWAMYQHIFVFSDSIHFIYLNAYVFVLKLQIVSEYYYNKFPMVDSKKIYAKLKENNPFQKMFLDVL